MKIKTLLLAVAAMFGMSAMANTAATDTLSVADFSCYPGDTVTVPVNFKNATAYAAIQWDVYFDSDKLVPVKAGFDEDGDSSWVTRGDHVLKTHFVVGNYPVTDQFNVSDHALRVVIYHGRNKQIPAGSGIVANFFLSVDKDIEPGDYTGTIGGWIKYSTGVSEDKGKNDGNGPSTTFNIEVKPKTITGVTDVTTAKAVKQVRYINPAGQVSAQPFDGINIIETTYDDGTKSVTKVVK